MAAAIVGAKIVRHVRRLPHKPPAVAVDPVAVRRQLIVEAVEADLRLHLRLGRDGGGNEWHNADDKNTGQKSGPKNSAHVFLSLKGLPVQQKRNSTKASIVHRESFP